MGMAYYYMKVKFESDISDKLLKDIKDFLLRANECKDEWQRVRGESNGFKTLVDKYGDIMSAFSLDTLDPDPNLNCISGKLASPLSSWVHAEGQEDEREIEDGQCDSVGCELFLCGEVWHMADWDWLGNALKKKFNALKFVWISEEETDPWQCLPDY